MSGNHAHSLYSVSKLYMSVIEDVIIGTREAFLDEGVDEQIQQELRMLWESKLLATKAVETDSGNASANGGSKGFGKSDKSGASKGADGGQGGSSIRIKEGAMEGVDKAPVQLPIHAIEGEPNSQILVPIQITMPRGPSDPPRSITIHVPAACIHSNKLQGILSLPAIQACLALPTELATTSLQGLVNQALISAGIPIDPSRIPQLPQNQPNRMLPQLDGFLGDSSTDDDDDDEDENDDDDPDDKDEEEEEPPEEEEAQDEEPLNSGDDVSDNEESTEKLYEIDNVIVCQYDKITRTRNKWKFHLKDGIMNLNGKDFVFQKANGDAEW